MGKITRDYWQAWTLEFHLNMTLAIYVLQLFEQILRYFDIVEALRNGLKEELLPSTGSAR